jgi:hypothetical protein
MEEISKVQPSSGKRSATGSAEDLLMASDSDALLH